MTTQPATTTTQPATTTTLRVTTTTPPATTTTRPATTTTRPVTTTTQRRRRRRNGDDDDATGDDDDATGDDDDATGDDDDATGSDLVLPVGEGVFVVDLTAGDWTPPGMGDLIGSALGGPWMLVGVEAHDPDLDQVDLLVAISFDAGATVPDRCTRLGPALTATVDDATGAFAGERFDPTRVGLMGDAPVRELSLEGVFTDGVGARPLDDTTLSFLVDMRELDLGLGSPLANCDLLAGMGIPCTTCPHLPFDEPSCLSLEVRDLSGSLDPELTLTPRTAVDVVGDPACGGSGAAFACGDTACDLADGTWCLETHGGPAGSPTVWTCEPLPTECLHTPLCDCILEHALDVGAGSEADCRTTPEGGHHVTLALP